MDYPGGLATSTRMDASQASENLRDFAMQLVGAERKAREAALAEMRKMLDWRFVHFAEEFKQRLTDVEKKHASTKEQLRSAACRAEMEQRLAAAVPEVLSGKGSGDDSRFHLLEGKFEIVEHRLAEVQRWSKAFEERFVNEQNHLAETEAWLGHLNRRFTGSDSQFSGSQIGTSSRLTPVERLTIDGHSLEADAHARGTVPGSVSRSGGGSRGSGYSGGAASLTARYTTDGPMTDLFAKKDGASAYSASTKESTNYASPASPQSLTPTSPSIMELPGLR